MFLPFTTHGVEDTASLIDWHLSFFFYVFNVFFSFLFFFPFFSFFFPFLFPFSPSMSLESTLHVTFPFGTETLVRHYILIPFLYGRVYHAGTYLVGNQQAKRVHDKLWHWESHWIICMIYSVVSFLSMLRRISIALYVLDKTRENCITRCSFKSA